MSKTNWFIDDPALAWGFYSHRQHLYHTAEPHEGFSFLLEQCTRKEKAGGSFYVIINARQQCRLPIPKSRL